MGTAAAVITALQAAPQVVSIVEAGVAALGVTFSADDQAQVDAAIAAAKTKLDADVASMQAE
jgi:hypothetical protein